MNYCHLQLVFTLQVVQVDVSKRIDFESTCNATDALSAVKNRPHLNTSGVGTQFDFEDKLTYGEYIHWHH